MAPQHRSLYFWKKETVKINVIFKNHLFYTFRFYYAQKHQHRRTCTNIVK